MASLHCDGYGKSGLRPVIWIGFSLKGHTKCVLLTSDCRLFRVILHVKSVCTQFTSTVLSAGKRYWCVRALMSSHLLWIEYRQGKLILDKLFVGSFSLMPSHVSHP